MFGIRLGPRRNVQPYKSLNGLYPVGSLDVAQIQRSARGGRVVQSFLSWRVSLVRCAFKRPLAFSTFPED